MLTYMDIIIFFNHDTYITQISSIVNGLVNVKILFSHDGLSLSGLQKPTPYFKIYLLLLDGELLHLCSKRRAGYTVPFLYCSYLHFIITKLLGEFSLSNILTFRVKPSYHFLVGLVKLLKLSVTGGFLFVHLLLCEYIFNYCICFFSGQLSLWNFCFFFK